MTQELSSTPRISGAGRLPFLTPAEDLLRQVQADVAQAGGAIGQEPDRTGSIGSTMFDLPGSEDNTLAVLLPQENAQQAPSQALLRIASRDGRTYLGIVTAGPFAEPDTLRADSHLLVTVTARGGVYMPPYHGRIQVTLLGELLAGGALVPPRLRPLPNSPVFALNSQESRSVLKADGDLRLGLVVGHEEVVVSIPSREKHVLPRHLAILGTTGGGKSTTVGRLIQQAQASGMAVVLLDVEGEYARLNEPADNPAMVEALRQRDLKPQGLPPGSMTLYHLVGRDSAHEEHPNRKTFSLQFARLSPYTAMEILELSEAQQVRFLEAYDIAKDMVRDLGLFPVADKNGEGREEQERIIAELDEFERGYPRLRLSLLLDVVYACHSLASRKTSESGKSRRGAQNEEEPVGPFEFPTYSQEMKSQHAKDLLRRKVQMARLSPNAISWRSVVAKLSRLQRLRVFDVDGVDPVRYKELLRPGHVSVVDLHDSGASELNNIVIADILRGIQEGQDLACAEAEKARKTGKAAPPARVLLIIEEAHEFLSTDRIEDMPVLFKQVARMAKRGRKRWISLAFVTQLPQHMPRQVLGLVNSYILHKINDPMVVSTLQKTISGIDTGLWTRLPGLAPGQAIVSFPHLARPLLVAVDPSPARLRLID